MLLGISQNLIFRLLIVINIGAYNLEASEGQAILAIDNLALIRFPFFLDLAFIVLKLTNGIRMSDATHSCKLSPQRMG